jgi:single-strand DNA-binding protein
MNLNQLSIVGYIGRSAKTKYLANGTAVTKFSVATKKSWKDENNKWNEKTQWHNVVAFGKGFEQVGGAARERRSCFRAGRTGHA